MLQSGLGAADTSAEAALFPASELGDQASFSLLTKDAVAGKIAVCGDAASPFGKTRRYLT
jgi:hypothetical protein